MAPLLDLLLVLLSCAFVSHAHNIQLKAHARECFHEILHADDKMTVTFQVGDREFGGSGNLDVDFWVCWSHKKERSSTGSRRRRNVYRSITRASTQCFQITS